MGRSHASVLPLLSVSLFMNDYCACVGLVHLSVFRTNSWNTASGSFGCSSLRRTEPVSLYLAHKMPNRQQNCQHFIPFHTPRQRVISPHFSQIRLVISVDYSLNKVKMRRFLGHGSDHIWTGREIETGRESSCRCCWEVKTGRESRVVVTGYTGERWWHGWREVVVGAGESGMTQSSGALHMWWSVGEIAPANGGSASHVCWHWCMHSVQVWWESSKRLVQAWL